MKLKQRLVEKIKQLDEILEIKKSGVFRNSDIEILKIEH